MGLVRKSFKLRPASSGDFQFAWSLYQDLMKPLTLELLPGAQGTGQYKLLIFGRTDCYSVRLGAGK